MSVTLRGKIDIIGAAIPAFVELVPVRSHNRQAVGRLELTGFPDMGLRIDIWDAMGTHALAIELDAAGCEGFPK